MAVMFAARSLCRISSAVHPLITIKLINRHSSIEQGSSQETVTTTIEQGSSQETVTTTIEQGSSQETDTITTTPVTRVKINDVECKTPKEAKTNLINFLNLSDIQKRQQNCLIPFFTPGSYLAVTYSDSLSQNGISRFVGICIAKRNKGLGSNFILRNVIDGTAVEKMFEIYSPNIKEIKVLKLERRRRAKLYYLRDKPNKYSSVSQTMEPVISDKISVYKRRGGLA